MKIDQNNWTSAKFKNTKYMAFVSMGGELAKEASGSSQTNFIYFLTLTDEDMVEIMQEEFLSLDDALKDLNRRYSHWELWTGEKGGTGCSTCEAH